MVKNNFYLIDYENVNRNGLYGLEKLSNNDRIFIFTSIPHRFNDYEYLKTSNYDIFKVSPGNQSVDKNLLFCLGYLIGKYECNTINFIIISKDKGYNKIIDFWKNKINGLNIQRFHSILEERNASLVNQHSSLILISSRKSMILSDEEALYNDIREELSKNNYSIYISNDVVSIVSKYYRSKFILLLVHNSLQMKYSYPCYWDLYWIIRPIIKRHQFNGNSLNNNKQNKNYTLNKNNSTLRNGGIYQIFSFILHLLYRIIQKIMKNK